VVLRGALKAEAVASASFAGGAAFAAGCAATGVGMLVAAGCAAAGGFLSGFVADRVTDWFLDNTEPSVHYTPKTLEGEEIDSFPDGVDPNALFT